MIAFLATIIGALASGATAKANDLGGTVLADAYDGLRTLLVRKLGKSGAVTSLEEDPDSESAKAALAEVMAKSGLTADAELADRADAVRRAVPPPSSEAGSIDVGNITARVNVLIENLVAAGHIKLGDIVAGQDAVLRNLQAGASPPKKA